MENSNAKIFCLLAHSDDEAGLTGAGFTCQRYQSASTLGQLVKRVGQFGGFRCAYLNGIG
nr:hypothetical protein [Rhodococcus yunnanensis]